MWVLHTLLTNIISSLTFSIIKIEIYCICCMFRVAEVDVKRENPGDVSTAVGSKDDVEMLMSQMHDLSFMLENNLSIPPK